MAAAACLALAAGGSGDAEAQGTPAPVQGTVSPQQVQEMEAERDRVFDQLRARPDDLDLLFRYAQISQALGDLEAAAATYERMLIYNPNLPRVRLELALLYFRLGSYGQSRAYIAEVLARPDLPELVRRNAELLLAEIDMREGQDPGMRFYGSIFGAIRWQDNANAGPDSRVIDIGGLDFLLSDEATGQEDFSALISARLGNYIPISPSFGWRSVGQVTYVDYFRLNRLDQLVLRLDTGPQFITSAWGRQLTFWPYGFVEHYRLGGDSYYLAGGGGMTTTYALNRETSILFEVEAAYRDYTPSSSSSSIDLRDGTVMSASLGLFNAYANGVTWSIAGEIGRTNADAGYYSATRYAGSAALAYEFNPGFGLASGDWRVGGRASVRLDQYDDPDPFLDPTTTRRDVQYAVGGFVTMPVYRRATLVFDADWRTVDSNYALYTYSATTLTLGLRYDF